jgi:medium-chain acyl-[acyl-carrier-protein] hydrolase
MIDPVSTWIVRPNPNEHADLRLFCVPHVGGSAMIFRTWPQDLPDYVEVCAIELPGRGRRIKEAPFSCLRSLVDALADSILPYLDRPCALFGHSFGALVCFELARELRNRLVPIPVLLCVSGAKAPQFLVDGSSIHMLPDPRLIDKVRRLGGTPEAVLENEELVSALLPALRADFEALETYVYSDATPLRCPILGLGGAADHRVDRDSLRAWAEHTIAGFKLEMFPGDHFFIHQAQPQILQTLGAALEHSLPLMKDE